MGPSVFLILGGMVRISIPHAKFRPMKDCPVSCNFLGHSMTLDSFSFLWKSAACYNPQ